MEGGGRAEEGSGGMVGLGMEGVGKGKSYLSELLECYKLGGGGPFYFWCTPGKKYFGGALIPKRPAPFSIID